MYEINKLHSEKYNWQNLTTVEAKKKIKTLCLIKGFNPYLKAFLQRFLEDSGNSLGFLILKKKNHPINNQKK